MKLVSHSAAFIITLSVFLVPATAQEFSGFEMVKLDTNFVRVYRDELTTRIYLSRKQNGYNLSEGLATPWLRYRTNDNLLLGIGYTYTFLTINLAVKMPFINKDDDIYGKSKYMDLTAHGIFRSTIVDLYLQWNTGYYISNPGNIIPDWEKDQGYPIRGDMRTNILGLNVQYLFNSSRYSYKAAFLQNEFQKRSAGSPIAGIEAHWMLGMTDSLMVPGTIPPFGFLNNAPFNRVDIVNMGINGGYAHTFVWKEKLYLSLSTTIGLSGGNNQVHNTINSTTCCSNFTVGMTSSSRVSLGYNSHHYYVGLSWIHFTMRNRVGDQGNWFAYTTGNIRLNFVRRFNLKRPIKILRPDLWILH